ncbi:MAG TPA: ABC transporter ATP-binding protein [Lacunisphaera sp.]|nr:ABC transporter ATP-binding protein [Lacunisphaera sp.]
MAHVTLSHLTKKFADRSGTEIVAVRDVDLEIRDREFMVLVGPSGCGKSTTLRMVAGLEEISSGTVAIDGRVVNDVPPKDRDIAMVFQNYALYPHMSVYENMAFGLKLRGLPKREIDARVREAAGLLGLADLLDRKPKALSGGQRQRVAVGRAIVRKPKVFLFDEPLSNLDAKMRVSMRTELTKLHARLQATMIYVTHDQVEAMTMGDRICVMKDGVITQVAPPLELYRQPANLFVGGFIGSPPMNFFRGTLGAVGDGLVFTENNPAKALRLTLPAGPGNAFIGRPVVLGLRPEALRLATNAEPDTAIVHVELAEPMGAETYLHLNTGATLFIARVGSEHGFRTGANVRIGFDPAQARLFDAESEQAIG